MFLAVCQKQVPCQIGNRQKGGKSMSRIITLDELLDMPSPPPMVYTAGPYTNPDPVVNTHKAIKFGLALWEQLGILPFTPHLTLMSHMVCPKPINFWYSIDLAYIDHCDAILRMPGSSSGADAEMEYAYQNRIPELSFYALPDDIKNIWLKELG